MVVDRFIPGDAGADPQDGAIKGASEISLAITMSTLTSVAVFLPVILMNQDADMLSSWDHWISHRCCIGGLVVGCVRVYTLATTFLKAKQLKEPRIIWIKQLYTGMLMDLTATIGCFAYPVGIDEFHDDPGLIGWVFR